MPRRVFPPALRHQSSPCRATSAGRHPSVSCQTPAPPRGLRVTDPRPLPSGGPSGPASHSPPRFAVPGRCWFFVRILRRSPASQESRHSMSAMKFGRFRNVLTSIFVARFQQQGWFNRSRLLFPAIALPGKRRRCQSQELNPCCPLPQSCLQERLPPILPGEMIKLSRQGVFPRHRRHRRGESAG